MGATGPLPLEVLMSRLLTRLTVGACLAAIPVFMPTSLHPGVIIPGAPAVAQRSLPVAPTHYVLTQASVVLSAAQTLQVKHAKSKLHATVTTTPPLLPGGLNGLTAVPTAALAAYQAAALRTNALVPGCHLSWQLLAGIGEIESHHASTGGSGSPTWNGIAQPAILGPTLDGSIGQAIRDSDHGHLDGNRIWDRAVGPMQFLPATWASFGVDADHDGSVNPQDIRDAAAAAGDYLCKGNVDLNDPSQLAQAVYSYNAADWYVSDVLTLAATYGNSSVTATGSGAAIDTAIAFAYAHLGDPYLWGGTGPLYDCSG
ncbi:MAG: Membrane-bound lytic murein transglycosylase B-like protein, partial [Frankiales bacterium]|nr:Membrane-bound lytic murein transglycosylase B-like protein [Frankiales bacterium]